MNTHKYFYGNTKEYTIYILKGDIQKKDTTTEDAIPGIALLKRRLFFNNNRSATEKTYYTEGK